MLVVECKKGPPLPLSHYFRKKKQSNNAWDQSSQHFSSSLEIISIPQMLEITLGVSRFLGYVFVLLDWCRCDLDLWGNEEKYWGVASDWVINDDTLFEKWFVQPFGNQASRKDCRGRTFSWWAQHSCNYILHFLMALFLRLKMNIYENTRIQE